jgi:hypothetical protein
MNVMDESAPSDHQIGRARASGLPFAAWAHPHRPGGSAPFLLAPLREIPFTAGREAALRNKAKASRKLLFKSLEESTCGGRRNRSQRPFNSQCVLLDPRPISAGLSRGP